MMPDATSTVLDELRAFAKPNTAKIYRRHGARGEVLGVPFADLYQIVKRLRGRHDLAAPLWATGIIEARTVATLVADPDALDHATIAAWVGATTDRGMASAVADLVAKRPDAPSFAAAWVDDGGEWVAYAGWSAYASLAMEGRLDDAAARALLERIRLTIHDAPNLTRHSMQMALIAIGIAMPACRDDAIAASGLIGKVRVDHGQTGCITPDAVPYIARAVARRDARDATRAAKAPRPSRPRLISPA